MMEGTRSLIRNMGEDCMIRHEIAVQVDATLIICYVLDEHILG